ncbi:hypothetical protein [Paenibacillus radicis (ex Gao et al. 2016)]|uniref:hypothetical protein n=1 Tax=Paenibacillus radicis (ex Gao et al. 2016) TaxID=1737354 RepID=UPI00166EFBE7|nr:hypothetical protein [Paenibacillus radicis (ex Gao et al. 2016)]
MPSSDYYEAQQPSYAKNAIALFPLHEADASLPRVWKDIANSRLAPCKRQLTSGARCHPASGARSPIEQNAKVHFVSMKIAVFTLQNVKVQFERAVSVWPP